MSEAAIAVKELNGEGPDTYSAELIEALVKIYHEMPSSSFQAYFEGRQAGIRYTLLALNIKIDGINK